MKRRDFILKAGAAVVLGASGLWAVGSKTGVPAAQAVPSSGRQPVRRWGMVIDVSKFKNVQDYAAVINACNRTHNIPDFGNSKDEIKWIWQDSYEHTFPDQENQFVAKSIEEKPFLLMCNHCDNPPCVRVCPTGATFKRPDGIVAMDYHRCIGCRFCMAACPFGARSFNFCDPRPFIKDINPDYPTRTKGVVEKCNFCADRLDAGLQPICVEKSNGGLIFGDLANPESNVRQILDSYYTIRRKPELGTSPSVYYVIGRQSNA